MQTETAAMSLEQKLQQVYERAFYRRYEQGYEKPFAEAYAEGFREGYKEGMITSILNLKGYVEADILAERLRISENDILKIREEG